MKSETTIRELHTQGKPDRQLSMNFDEENEELEYYRKLRLSHPHIREYAKLHQLQFKITRTLYQMSDEYKKTRGY